LTPSRGARILTAPLAPPRPWRNWKTPAKEKTVPSDTQKFTITNTNANPSGSGATMSITGAGNKPSKGYWHSADAEYTVKLPVSVWNATANDPSGTLYVFTVARNTDSATIALQSNAPHGSQSYEIVGPPGLAGGNTNPTVVVDP
jgi:hypothetical protein